MGYPAARPALLFSQGGSATTRPHRLCSATAHTSLFATLGAFERPIPHLFLPAQLTAAAMAPLPPPKIPQTHVHAYMKNATSTLVVIVPGRLMAGKGLH